MSENTRVTGVVEQVKKMCHLVINIPNVMIELGQLGTKLTSILKKKINNVEGKNTIPGLLLMLIICFFSRLYLL